MTGIFDSTGREELFAQFTDHVDRVKKSLEELRQYKIIGRVVELIDAGAGVVQIELEMLLFRLDTPSASASSDSRFLRKMRSMPGIPRSACRSLSGRYASFGV